MSVPPLLPGRTTLRRIDVRAIVQGTPPAPAADDLGLAQFDAKVV
jgi:hypothetical protein